MLDIGWSEMLLIAVVAIIVIGPKDLPKVLRTVGNWVARVRAAAREFQSGIDQMIADSELEDLRNTANSIQNFDSEKLLDPTSGSSQRQQPGEEQDSAQDRQVPSANGDGERHSSSTTLTSDGEDYLPPDEEPREPRRTSDTEHADMQTPASRQEG